MFDSLGEILLQFVILVCLLGVITRLVGHSHAVISMQIVGDITCCPVKCFRELFMSFVSVLSVACCTVVVFCAVFNCYNGGCQAALQDVVSLYMGCNSGVMAHTMTGS